MRKRTTKKGKLVVSANTEKVKFYDKKIEHKKIKIKKEGF